MQGLRTGAPLPGARHTAARILLFLDGFDELQAEEGGEEPTRDTRLRLRNLYATVCGGGESEAWSPDVLRVVVTSRESRLNGRADERAVCGPHRRRVLLPFNQQQVCLGCVLLRTEVCLVPAAFFWFGPPIEAALETRAPHTYTLVHTSPPRHRRPFDTCRFADTWRSVRKAQELRWQLQMLVQALRAPTRAPM